MFKIGLSGQMFDALSIWDHLEAAADIGYDRVELRSGHVSPETPKADVERIRAFLRATGLAVSGLSCFTGNYGLLDDADCEAALGVFEKYVRLACFFDSPLVRLWPAWQASATAPGDVWEKAVVCIQRSADLAAKSGRRIVMEMHHGTLCDTVESSLRLLDRIDRENVGLTVDPVNLYQVPTEYGPAAIRRLGRKVFNVHIKDIIELKTPDYAYAFPYSYYAEHIGRFTKVVPPASGTERYYAHRRIGHGGVDWSSVLRGIRDIGYDGPLVVESVSETNRDMPSGRALAEVCFRDVRRLTGQLPASPRSWHFVSPSAEGLHPVVTPERSECRVAHFFRLNVAAGSAYVLESGALEMDVALIAGTARVEMESAQHPMRSFDSFYVPGGTKARITASENAVFYIAGAPCEGRGRPFFRQFQRDLPPGAIHQWHGEGTYKREVFFTLDPETPASRLICGFTWGNQGGWTSWPPHQHEEHLEEIYCYFGILPPAFGLHLSYNESGHIADAVAHVVRSGHAVIAPKGYHPTVASPVKGNVYFWILAALSPEGRRYDLAKTDPLYDPVAQARAIGHEEESRILL